ncbi:hypothetical protein ACFFHM_23115 [Halalkalibacter kiskunsagensis]|uniref:Pectate lyase superfamily protein domain-containing protein n=1 Tax=Halalkalibacter kiskunsagensis TaxID=1548599 RepID=A0ABV6KK21_9BACI
MPIMKKGLNIILPEIPSRSFYITDFGAVGDGIYDNTNAFQRDQI